MRHILRLSLGLILFFSVSLGQVRGVVEYSYTARHFLTGDNAREITIKTRDGKEIASMEIAKGVFLLVYADHSTTISKDQTEFSGMVSIRTKAASDIKAGDGAEEMSKGATKLEFPDAVVILKIIKE